MVETTALGSSTTIYYVGFVPQEATVEVAFAAKGGGSGEVIYRGGVPSSKGSRAHRAKPTQQP